MSDNSTLLRLSLVGLVLLAVQSPALANTLHNSSSPFFAALVTFVYPDDPRDVFADESLEALREPPAELPFGFNSARLDQIWYGAVGRIADLLYAQPSLSVILIGHADPTGETDYDLSLSYRRANYVAQLLINDFAIAPERIRATGLGIEDPLIEEVGRAANEKNRRVEILFQTSDTVSADRRGGHSRG